MKRLLWLAPVLLCACPAKPPPRKLPAPILAPVPGPVVSSKAKALAPPANMVNLVWEQSAGAVSNELFWGPASRAYSNSVSFPAATNWSLLAGQGTTYYAVTAIGTNGASDYSNEAVYSAPAAATNVLVTLRAWLATNLTAGTRTMVWTLTQTNPANQLWLIGEASRTNF